jgi:hypothetical protein
VARGVVHPQIFGLAIKTGMEIRSFFLSTNGDKAGASIKE